MIMLAIQITNLLSTIKCAKSIKRLEIHLFLPQSKIYEYNISQYIHTSFSLKYK